MKAILIIIQVKPIGKKKFIVAIFNLKAKTWKVIVDNFFSFNLYINAFYQAHIEALLSIDVFRNILNKYTDFVNIFLPKVIFQLLSFIETNNHAI